MKHIPVKEEKDDDATSVSGSDEESDSESDDDNPFAGALNDMFNLKKPSAGGASASASKAKPSAAGASGGAGGSRASQTPVKASCTRGATPPPGESQKGSPAGDEKQQSDVATRRARGRPREKVTDLSNAPEQKAEAVIAEVRKLTEESAEHLTMSEECDMSVDGIKEAKKALTAKGKHLEVAIGTLKKLEKNISTFDAMFGGTALSGAKADLAKLSRHLESALFVSRNLFNAHVDFDRFLTCMGALLERARDEAVEVSFTYYSKYMGITSLSNLRFANMKPFIKLCKRDEIESLGFRFDTSQEMDKSKKVVMANIEVEPLESLCTWHAAAGTGGGGHGEERFARLSLEGGLRRADVEGDRQGHSQGGFQRRVPAGVPR